MLPALDISQYQGTWIDRGDPIVMIKMSGGDDGLYMDSQAAGNYSGAIADGRAVGGYHFIGWTLGAAQEAAWFFKAMSPVAENDVFALDIEKGQVAVPANAPAYVMEMINYLEGKGITGGLLYMNLSTLNAFDWSGPLSKWGLWLADWAVAPTANIPTNHVYVMQQFSDGPNYDHDEWFGTVEEFKKYGYHALAAPVPEPTPVPSPPAPPVVEPSPSPVVPTEPSPESPSPTPPAENPTAPVTVVETQSRPIKKTILALIAAVAAVVAALLVWLHN